MGYGTSSEYVRDLIRCDLDRQAVRTLLDKMNDNQEVDYYEGN